MPAGTRRLFSYFYLIFLALLVIFQHGNDHLVKAYYSNHGFVQTNGSRFSVNGKPLFLNGFNAYWMMYFAADPSTRVKVTAAFEQANKYGMNIARTWAFGDGGYRALQNSPGSYNEDAFKVVFPYNVERFLPLINLLRGIINCGEYEVLVWWCVTFFWLLNGVLLFQGLDFVVSEARKYGVYVILSLVNNFKDYGGRAKYVEWARERGQSLKDDDEFYTNSLVKQYYKNHVKVRMGVREMTLSWYESYDHFHMMSCLVFFVWFGIDIH